MNDFDFKINDHFRSRYCWVGLFPCDFLFSRSGICGIFDSLGIGTRNYQVYILRLKYTHDCLDLVPMTQCQISVPVAWLRTSHLKSIL